MSMLSAVSAPSLLPPALVTSPGWFAPLDQCAAPSKCFERSMSAASGWACSSLAATTVTLLGRRAAPKMRCTLAYTSSRIALRSRLGVCGRADEATACIAESAATHPG
eukprot:2979281-Prymnesium_polylepis.2